VTTFSGPVVCGVDFSAGSRRALVRAHALARRLGLRLDVVSAIDPLLAEAANVGMGPVPFPDRVRRDLDDFIRSAVGRTRAGAPAISTHTPVGAPAKELLAAAAAAKASLVVIGTEGLGRARRLLLGSTTLRVMRASERPVLAVPPPKGRVMKAKGAGTRVEVKRILCGVDFGDASRAAAEAAVALGRSLSVPVVLVHAVARLAMPSMWDIMVTPTDKERAGQAKTGLQALAAGLGKPAPGIRVAIGEPDEVFGREVRSSASALIVLGLGDAGGHRPGSTALRIMTETHAPVLVVPMGRIAP
jgi:nucleotide-binding universal stress UspA family protein